MTMYLHVADYIVFGVTLLITAVIGLYYFWRDKRKQSQELPASAQAAAESYFIANRDLHFLPTTASLFASFVSAIALVGIPAEFYEYGAGFFLYCVAMALGTLFAGVLIVPIMYRLRLLSAFAYIELRFGSRFLRRIGSVSGVCCTVLYLAAVTLAPCVALKAVTPIPVWMSVAAVSVITMFYSVLGGMRAIVLVDLFQAILMFAGVIAAIAVGFSRTEGGITNAMAIAYDGGRLNFFDWNPDPRSSYSVYALLIPSILSNTGLYGTTQGSVQRYSGLKTMRLAVWSVLAIAPQILVLAVILLLLAVAMYAHYSLTECDPISGKLIDSPNQLTTYYMADILGTTLPGLVGLWFAAIFSGSLSTMSTGYNSIAALIWDDFMKDNVGKRLTPNQSSYVYKLVSLAAGIVVFGFAIVFQYVPGSAIRLVVSTATVFECATYIPYACGMFMPWTNATGVIIGIVVGVAFTSFLSIGQLLGYGGQGFPTLPAVTTGCPVTSTVTNDVTPVANLTTVSTIVEDLGATSYLFSITPFYYPLIELTIGCVTATVASIIARQFAKQETSISAFSLFPPCARLFKIADDGDREIQQSGHQSRNSQLYSYPSEGVDPTAIELSTKYYSTTAAG